MGCCSPINTHWFTLPSFVFSFPQRVLLVTSTYFASFVGPSSKGSGEECVNVRGEGGMEGAKDEASGSFHQNGLLNCRLLKAATIYK